VGSNPTPSARTGDYLIDLIHIYAFFGQGCMAQKGYVLVHEEEADARSQEYAAIAAEKKQREIAAVAPAPSSKKKPTTTAQHVSTSSPVQ
jgi:hypothetical protein